MSQRLPGREPSPPRNRSAARQRRRVAAPRPSAAIAREASAWLGDDRLFTPLAYEPAYDYPLLVWLPDASETTASPGFDLGRMMTKVSLRNFIAVEPAASPHDPAGTVAEDRVWRSIDRARERLSVHERRIFLVGCGTGGTEAFRIACRHPDQFAGVVSLGGPFPLAEGLFARIAEVRRLPMLMCCQQGGQDDARAAQVDHTLRLFHAAGASLAMRIYPGCVARAACVLADVNRWIMAEVCGPKASVHSFSAS